ncbi:hypothetical protein J6590_103821 [Homalodisca vitripennis]|nr:hypothetical protein J6590_103821 [Homalodisca vitripennis]
MKIKALTCTIRATLSANRSVPLTGEDAEHINHCVRLSSEARLSSSVCFSHHYCMIGRLLCIGIEPHTAPRLSPTPSLPQGLSQHHYRYLMTHVSCVALDSIT